ncbi:L,D-transpeptidase [Hydrogenovibrio sp. 3SP14C1]|uniref:L,D-transpeptidase n=1 Tax=Hydrogenovibrio sp. 3SP14C1 TaxID=3038774 RepID=UPI0024176DA3|nr:L,D-transpeptidase [Hydrogenovibrio sp. 3SP14C1]MDG4812862.1 L,D-transpeptidase [Hydrogenovibrio sp. 3SP14C1]
MFLYLSISQQSLTVFASEQDRAEPVRTFKISTALNGMGSEKNSGKTPTGRLMVRAKIGQGLPMNSVFVARRPTGEIYSDALAQSAPNRDWILTRILWLSGMEVGQNRLGNVDTMQRYIYIHGTPDTEPMGVPKSHGCIRMRNQDVLALFDLIPVGTEMVVAA